ncbi:uncharacterized protein LOC132721027 isoform X2 [Ruditapes philippinarum]|uniref:uncharacterized protein LOC132721027 isoform X2 n=1 Tax=Ruditapes philippinarum TaxID=129788 RepID=UPI00295AEE5E|nr:uncharacterized protein LOC132721027 isoform X2 [Ruditapes philippinarum]
MSRRTAADYVAVLKAIRDKLESVSVVGFMLDFELAAWNAVREVFGQDVDIKGCVFHWCQEVWRQVQANGLSTTYNARKNTQVFASADGTSISSSQPYSANIQGTAGTSHKPSDCSVLYLPGKSMDWESLIPSEFVVCIPPAGTDE